MATANEEVWELWHRTHCRGAISEGFVDRGTASEIAALIEKESDAEYEDGVSVTLWVRSGDWRETETRSGDWLSNHKAKTRSALFWQRVNELGLDARFGFPQYEDETCDSFADGFHQRSEELTFESFVDCVFACRGDVIFKHEDLARERYLLTSFLSRAEKLVKARNLEPMYLAKYRVKTGRGDGDFVLRFVEWTDRWTPEGEEWTVPLSHAGGELLYSYAAPVHLGKGYHALNCRVSENGMTRLPKDVLPSLLLESDNRRGVMWIELSVYRKLDGEDTRGIWCVMSDSKFIELFGLDATPPNRDFVKCFVNELGYTIIPKAVMKRVGIPNGGGVMYLRELDGKTVLLSDADYVKQMGFGSEDKDDPDV